MQLLLCDLEKSLLNDVFVRAFEHHAKLFARTDIILSFSYSLSAGLQPVAAAQRASFGLKNQHLLSLLLDDALVHTSTKTHRQATSLYRVDAHILPNSIEQNNMANFHLQDTVVAPHSSVE